MYHCRVHFYFIGSNCRVADVIKEMAPLEHFTHEFSENGGGLEDLAADADVIFVNLQGLDAEKTLRELAEKKKQGAEVILLADKDAFIQDRKSVV